MLAYPRAGTPGGHCALSFTTPASVLHAEFTGLREPRASIVRYHRGVIAARTLPEPPELPILHHTAHTAPAAEPSPPSGIPGPASTTRSRREPVLELTKQVHVNSWRMAK